LSSSAFLSPPSSKSAFSPIVGMRRYLIIISSLSG
jgi:hypothetical protein